MNMKKMNPIIEATIWEKFVGMPALTCFLFPEERIFTGHGFVHTHAALTNPVAVHSSYQS